MLLLEIDSVFLRLLVGIVSISIYLLLSFLFLGVLYKCLRNLHHLVEIAKDRIRIYLLLRKINRDYQREDEIPRHHISVVRFDQSATVVIIPRDPSRRALHQNSQVSMAHVKDLRKAMLGGNCGMPKRPGGGETFLLKKDYSAVSASDYFGKARFISVDEIDRLYLYETEISGAEVQNTPYLLFLHGGGYSGLTWAPVISQLSPMFTAEFGAVDLRGHGRSACENEMDLSTERVTEDLFQLVQKLNLGERSLILVGHSMGGAFAIHLSDRLQEESNINLAGLIVIDVVEGSALESLSGMQHVLRNRPKEFLSIASAIEWCVRSGQTRNADSARISMPGQLKLLNGDVPDSTMIDEPELTAEPVHSIPKSAGTTITCIQEEDSDEGCFTDLVFPQHSAGSRMQAPVVVLEKYVWRIDLKKTEPFWRGWFEGLSKKFLAVRAPKLLLLAGVDRLDKELMVAQMQGKFQMQVLSSVGHIVHEDAPDRVAEHIASFLARNKIIAATSTIPRLFPGC